MLVKERDRDTTEARCSWIDFHDLWFIFFETISSENGAPPRPRFFLSSDQSLDAAESCGGLSADEVPANESLEFDQSSKSSKSFPGL